MAVKVSPNVSSENSSLLRRIQAYAFGHKNINTEDHADASTTDSKVLLNTLQANVQQLEQLCSRMEFMLDEVSSLVRRRV